ncbi:Branched-chain amino acid transport ATP-binding protein LivG [Euzebya pacifica]|uniref:Branched-chain amino acid transport ATP-binding protein LivG n=1 Tax=Euzebya pacifica TaxID=1608957 RepID=A0A346XWF2_9ACTN|nr:ABC transporter ATP-binding protein [Euzebya pacifica]AXV06549.1 Branched-chain amino acid transport ATP-binding protein LivG [Euzebya pacifica]
MTQLDTPVPDTATPPLAIPKGDSRYLLETKGIAIRFGGVQALGGVDFRVAPNEIVGVLGPNGAGKTTFFNCVSGFASPNEGRVFIKGEDVTALRPDERVIRGLGRTFQQVGLIRSFTLLENLLVAHHHKVAYGDGAGMFGMPWARREERELRRRAMEVLEFFGIAHLAHRTLDGMPYGMLKLCEVAAVMAVDPDILMLDEPLAGMAPEEAAEFCDRLLVMRDQLNISIVMIDHHVPQVLRVSDYVFVLSFGKLLAEGRAEEIRTNPAVAEAYMGEGATTLD